LNQLPRFGYRPDQIAPIDGMVMAARYARDQMKRANIAALEHLLLAAENTG
jgi:hypothetical protein